MLVFECTIPGRCPIKKNAMKVVRNHGRVNVIYTHLFREWEKTAILYLKSSFRGREVIDMPLEARFTFKFLNHKWEPDVSNLVDSPQDALKKAGIISDDKIIQVLQANKEFGQGEETTVRLYTIE